MIFYINIYRKTIDIVLIIGYYRRVERGNNPRKAGGNEAN